MEYDVKMESVVRDCTHSVVVLVEIVRHHGFVTREGFFEIGIRITRNTECGRLYVMREHVKPNRSIYALVPSKLSRTSRRIAKREYVRM